MKHRNKRIKKQHHESSTVLRHLVLDGTRSRTGYAIKKGEFSRCETLETVRILQSSNIKHIGVEAFRDCASLRSIHIEAAVTEIRRNAFCNCRSLQAIRIPDTVLRIWDNAFDGCTSLQSAHIGDRVVAIGDTAFLDCPSLTSLRLPAGLKWIGQGNFNGAISLQSVHIPDTVTTFQNGTFWGCISLQSVNIPDGLTWMGSGIFNQCSSLQSIHLPVGLTAIGTWAFRFCSSLRSIAIPDTVTAIAPTAFDGCTTLEQRQVDHPTYHEDTITWLRRRFNNLPIHFACYHFGYNNTSSSTTTTFDNLCTLIQENIEALSTTDAMGMTPLHILCCNPNATPETMQIMVENEPSLLTDTDVTESIPLQVFFICRHLLQAGQPIPSFHGILEKNINCEDLAIISVLASNGEMDLSSPDEITGLSPFMTAAVVSASGLDVMYTLAMRNIESMI